MRTALDVLADVRVATPCPAAWEDMDGDDQVRYCGLCRKSVYNLSGMTPTEAADLILRTDGALCIRLLRRRDGTLLTSDCPVGLRQRLNRLWLLVRAAIVAVPALIAGLFWFGREDPPATTQVLGAMSLPEETGQPAPADPDKDCEQVVGKCERPGPVPPQQDDDGKRH